MLTYYQKSPKDPWEYVVSSAEANKWILDNQIPMASVISIKEPIEDDKEKHGKIYQGPFYIDIDVEGEPELAIESAQKFADKLQELGVLSFTIFLSGKKGFHFIVDQRNFSTGRATKSLPLIYKEMALELYVDGIDLAVYNEGRPRLLRVPNVKRKDNKKYKVQITLDELYALTPELYIELVSQPRPLFDPPEPKKSLKMEALYEACKNRMQKKKQALENMEFVPDEELKKTYVNGELPGCIKRLIEEGDSKPGSNFNQATIQFAAYMVKAGIEDWQKHARAMAKNVKSSSYNTEFARYSELKKMVNYVHGTKQYGFSKAMLFSVMEPCMDCPICNGTIEDGREVPEDYEEASEIIETPQGYYIGQGKQQRRLTTFTLEPVSRFTELPDDEGFGETRVGVNAIVKVNGHQREMVTILEDAWDSLRGFKQVIKGKKNYAVYGNDTDLQKIKNKLFADESNMTEINYVHSIGMHRHKIGEQTVFVYVEPGFSVSSTKEKNTHQVWGNIPAPPNIQTAKYPEANDELMEFIDHALNANDPELTSTLMGWFSLCHIKLQLTMRDNQFPLLNLWGNAGSGKSAISTLFAHLHGVDYMLEHSPMSLQGTTPWAVAQYCTTSESTPRVIEEFNRGEIPSSRYDQFCGMFKAAWNKQTFAKGSVEQAHVGGQRVSGAKVVEAQISAPLCVMSEQAPERPALRQRMIQVNVRKSGRERDGATESFYHIMDNREMFNGLARAMVWESLDTHPDWVANQMESFQSQVPKEIDARPQFSYQALLTGVKFFCKTLKTIGLPDEYIEEKEQFMLKAILGKLDATLDDVRIEKSRTEVSLVINEMAIMADAFDSDLQYSLQPGRHYMRQHGLLYLDPQVCHTLYTRWARSSGGKVIISSQPQFDALVQQEDFFVENCYHPDLGNGTRRLIKLNCEALQHRGIDVNMFAERG